MPDRPSTLTAIVGLSAIAILLVGCKQSPPRAAQTEKRENKTFSIALVDIANDATDPGDLDDSEPSIAVNPKNPNELAVVAFSGSWSPGVMAPIWKSQDSGTHWTKVFQIPAPASAEKGPGDQKISFDSDGRLYVAELAEQDDPDAHADDYVYRQATNPNEALTASPAYGDDQPHLLVDMKSTHCRNTLYTSWLKTGADRAMSTESFDFGQHLGDQEVGADLPNRTTRIAVSASGTAYMVYKSRESPSLDEYFERAHFRVKRSDDCGRTWTGLGSSGVSVDGSTPSITFFTDHFGDRAKGKVARARSSDAWIAASPNPDEVYVAYINRDASGHAQIYVARSGDQGHTWASARVTDGRHDVAFPEIAVTENGVVGVMYVQYDAEFATNIYEHHFAISPRATQPWQDVTLQRMDPGNLDNAADGFLWGDYEGLTSYGVTFFGVFTGESIGRKVLQMDPIFFRLDTSRSNY